MISCRMEPSVGAVFSLAVRNSGTCWDLFFCFRMTGELSLRALIITGVMVSAQRFRFSPGVLRSISVRNPKTIYIANVNARSVRIAHGVAKDLADNIAHGVRWHDATCIAQELGCELFLNVPPGHALIDLAKENLCWWAEFDFSA
jgi:acyl transferase domain-containing protein